jgi:hypothetical protein
MSNIIIPAEHQSSPKQTDLDKSVRTALTEIREGKFVPVVSKKSFDPMADDFFRTGTDLLEQHPRVKEALATLQTQVVDRTNAEYLEKAQQLHELNVMASREFRWEGQERWQGKDNEAMRTVNILTPVQFIEKLQAAGISAEMEPQLKPEQHFDENGVLQRYDVEASNAKICLGRAVYRGVVALRAWVKGEFIRVDKLQVPCGPEWTVVRFDEYNVPQEEKYHGWRTAVLALIIRGVITEAEAERAFGRVVENPASALYREELFKWRSEATK